MILNLEIHLFQGHLENGFRTKLMVQLKIQREFTEGKVKNGIKL